MKVFRWALWATAAAALFGALWAFFSGTLLGPLAAVAMTLWAVALTTSGFTLLVLEKTKKLMKELGR